MPESFEALAVVPIALLPGALYVWSFERLAGAWGVRLVDRLLRFVGVSAILHALAAPLTYRLWLDLFVEGEFEKGSASWAAWLAVLTYVAIPIALGSAVGIGTRARSGWTRLFTGPNPAPRAWDHLFGTHPDGWIRVRLKSGIWLGGAYATLEDGSRSYAAGYPEEQDLYLVEAVEVDPETGEFMLEDGELVSRGSAILVRWNEVEYLDFIDA
jgi:hypothetical protein